jgi:hypothetical protein
LLVRFCWSIHIHKIIIGHDHRFEEIELQILTTSSVLASNMDLWNKYPFRK